MTRFSLVFVLGLMLGAPAHAFGEDTGQFTDYEFVAPTDVATPGRPALALCYETDDLRFYGVTLLSNITGYVLATENCAGEPVRSLSPADVRAAQNAGLINPDLPAIAKNDVRRNLTNYGVWAAVILGLVAVIIRRVKALLGYDLRGPMRRKTTQRILYAMCHAGHRDGVIEGKEITLIRRTAQRLTRRSISTSQVVKAADKTGGPLGDADYIDMGRGLRDGEKDVLMRAVFYVTLASGRLLPREHEFLTRLAYGLGIPGEDFRRVMNLALSDLDRYPPR
ncbi:TerB family tellurite resistance protein [Yoonia litorea]|uniref:Tellurite resistance protein TerB n=1 Tax=Yoonia litorea TaxID=1123755 RepID=A0A1I6L5W6_9RHOB|nr:TerB family tellurite resistance protein [Yoonia litorea]SFR98834.1 hypothetical protein SAMN05444714_0221 [Yoonia litorea]